MNFLSALGFLTTLPVGSAAFREDGGQILHFPLVGLLIGALLWGVDALGARVLAPEVRALVDVLFLAVLTGALHLDGLADTADGLFAHRSRERALEIMKDPRVGVMGVLAVTFGLLLKTAALARLQGPTCGLWLLTAPAWARSAQVAGLVFTDYVRTGGGKSDLFFQKGRYGLLAFTGLPLGLTFVIGWLPGLITLAGVAGVTGVLIFYFRKKIGGMTGDTLGALTEVVETAALLTGATVCVQG